MIVTLTEEQKLDSLLENIVPISDSMHSIIQQIPLVYNESEGYSIVNYNDLDNLNTQFYSNIDNSINLVAESNNIDPNSIIVCVNEADLIEFPEIINELSNVNYVVDPIPMDNPTVQLCDYLVEEALETGDESCLDVLEEDYTVVNEVLDKLTPEEKKDLRKKLSTARYNSSKVARNEFEDKYRPIASRDPKIGKGVWNSFYYGGKKYETNGGKVTLKWNPKASRYKRFLAQNRKSEERTNLIKNAANINRIRKQPRVSFIKDVSKQNQLIDIAKKNKERMEQQAASKSFPKEAPKGGSTPQSRSAAYFYTVNNLHKNERPGVGEVAKRVFSLSKNKIKQADIPDKVGNAAYVGYKNAKEKLPIAKAKASQLAGQAKAMAGKYAAQGKAYANGPGKAKVSQLAGQAKAMAGKGVGIAGKYAAQGKGILNKLNPKNISVPSGLKRGALDAGIVAGGALLYKNRNSIINRIKGLRAKSDQLEKRMQAAPAPQKGIFRRIIDKIKSIIQKLMNKLRGR